MKAIVRLGVVAVLLLLSLNASAQTQIGIADLAKLNARFEKGKDTTYIVNLWATWCGPCRKELPEFDKLNMTLSGKKVKVILLSLDSYNNAQVKVGKYVSANKLLSEVVVFKGKPQELIAPYLSSKWNEAIPATLILYGGRSKHKFTEGPISKNFVPDLLGEMK